MFCKLVIHKRVLWLSVKQHFIRRYTGCLVKNKHQGLKHILIWKFLCICGHMYYEQAQVHSFKPIGR